MKSIGIIGFGSFGMFLVDAFRIYFPDIHIKVFSKTNTIDNKVFFSLEEVCSSDILIPCVTINAFEKTIVDIKPFLKTSTIVFEVCSIKQFPKKVLLENLSGFKIICSHPMFGPESFKKNNENLKGFNLVIENLTCPKSSFDRIVEKLRALKLNVIEMSAEEHDRKAANFQFTTILTALTIKGSGLKRTPIDTASASKMHDFSEMIGDDFGILKDMYKYNPHCKKQLNRIFNSFNKIVSGVIE